MHNMPEGSTTNDFFRGIAKQLQDPKPEYVATANVAFWAARVYGFILLAGATPGGAPIAAAVALIVIDTYVTYQISRILMMQMRL